MNRSNLKTPLRNGLLALAMGGALLTGFAAHAGTNAVSAWEEHKREEAAKQEGRQGGAAPAQRAPAPAQSQGGPPRGNWNAGGGAGAPPAVVGPPRGPAGGDYGRRDYGRRDYDRRDYDRRDYGGRRDLDRRDYRIVPPAAYAGRPPRYVNALPPGHRWYDWGGSRYYWGGGHWYRPYGSTFMLVGPPVGLFVSYLPSYYSTVWVGGDRYYFADGTYYTYEPVRHGYIVTRSPYGDDEEYTDSDGDDRNTRDQDMYIYPMRGQSEQQQSEDRYSCHRWAVDQTHYDPTDSSFDRKDRSEYDRAMSACLTGRGYSVK